MVKEKFLSKTSLEFFKKEPILKLLDQHAKGKREILGKYLQYTPF